LPELFAARLLRRLFDIGVLVWAKAVVNESAKQSMKNNRLTAIERILYRARGYLNMDNTSIRYIRLFQRLSRPPHNEIIII